jgi:hypothetical protein
MDPVMPPAVWWFFVRLDKNGDLPRWIRRKIEKRMPVGPLSLYLPSQVEVIARAKARMNPASALTLVTALQGYLNQQGQRLR